MRAAGPATAGQRARHLALTLWYVLIVLLLFPPIRTSIIYAFNVGSLGKQTSAFTGWTLDWYAAAWNNVSLRKTVQTSLVVAFWSALVAVLIGSALGYALVRHPSARVRQFLIGLTYLLL